MASFRSRGFSLVALTLIAGLAVAPAQTLAQDAATDKAAAAETGERTRVGRIDIEGKLLERLPEMSVILGGSEELTLRSVVDAISNAANDDDIDALMIRLKDAAITPTQVQELGAAMKRFRDAGKKIHVFSEAYGPTELMLGAYADEVIAQSGGPVMLPGLYMEEMFLADTLAWAGIKANMVQVGDYKGASEQMSRNKPSPQWDQNINQLLDSMYANLRAPMLSGRKLSETQLDSAMKDLWLAQADDAKTAGLVDSVIDLPTMTQHFKAQYTAPISWNTKLVEAPKAEMDLSNPFAMLSMLGKKPEYKTNGPTIGVVHIDGPIMDGDSSGGSPFGGGPSVGSRTIRNSLEDLLKNDDIKGVILRINSPGGSATASEVIWQGVQRVAEKKPVWVSVGSMAASGGYYIAVAGDRIYVNPSSIVGSIGVVGGKMSMQGLYDKLKVGVVGRGRGPRAEMFASGSDWSEQDVAEVRRKMTETYDLFTGRVTAGRKGIDLTKTAEGRLFTGEKALGLKMADAVGGLDDALRDMGKELGLADFDVRDYPAPRSFEEVLKESLGGMVAAPGVGVAGHGALSQNQLFGAIRAIVGERAYSQIEGQLTGMMQLREGKVLLMSPTALVFK